MRFIKHLLSSAKLTDNKLANPSITCISTSRPIYLVFGNESDHPAYVIRKITDDHAFHTHQVHKHLYQIVGNQVPKTFGIYEYEGEKYDIQKGAKGAPWFQLKSKISTEEARERLESRLWKTLTDFHSAIAADSTTAPGNAHEAKKLPPHEELLNAYTQYKNTEHTVNTKLDKLVDFAVQELLKMQACTRVPQHGDFCLNNLIIDTSHITVIDFEDFAITTMPMYDYFTLALSLPSCSEDPRLAINILKNPQFVSAAHNLEVNPNAIPWHFLHHILLRLGPWSTGEKRAPYRIWLKKLLGYFVEAQEQTNHSS